MSACASRRPRVREKLDPAQLEFGLKDFASFVVNCIWWLKYARLFFVKHDVPLFLALKRITELFCTSWHSHITVWYLCYRDTVIVHWDTGSAAFLQCFEICCICKSRLEDYRLGFGRFHEILEMSPEGVSKYALWSDGCCTDPYNWHVVVKLTEFKSNKEKDTSFDIVAPGCLELHGGFNKSLLKTY